MRERALLIGATLTIENHADGGVEVVLTAPPER
jgi:signal transduction histidine kinase